MGKILCFIPESFADYEITLALRLLKNIGKKQIVTVGYSLNPVTGLSGMRYVADITLDEAAALDGVEAFLMPGGPIVPRDEQLVSFITALHRQNVLLAAICFAPQYLARSGLLHTRRYTTSCSPEHIAKLGIEDPFPRGQFTNERVVTDGNIITAQGHAFVDFAFAVTRHLGFDPKYTDDLRQFYREIMDR